MAIVLAKSLLYRYTLKNQRFTQNIFDRARFLTEPDSRFYYQVVQNKRGLLNTQVLLYFLTFLPNNKKFGLFCCRNVPIRSFYCVKAMSFSFLNQQFPYLVVLSASYYIYCSWYMISKSSTGESPETITFSKRS